MKRSNLLFSSLQVPIDAVAIILAIVTAYYLRATGQDGIYLWPFDYYLRIALLFTPIWLIIFSTQGLYRVKGVRRGWDEFSAILIGTLYAWAFFTVGLYFVRTPQTIVFPRLILIYTLFIPLTYVTLAHWLMHGLQKYLYRYNIGVRRVLLIGSENQLTKNLGKMLQINPSLGYKINRLAKPSQVSEVQSIYQEEPFDDIILADPNLSESHVLDLIHFCEDKDLGFRQVPNIFEMKSSRIQITTLGNMPIIEFRHTPLEGWGMLIKRIFDLLGAAIFLAIAAIPMLIIALAIKLESAGPILYLHERIGQNGKKFFLYKFRTMKKEFCRGKNFGGDNAEKFFQELMQKPEYRKEFEKDFKLKKDPRITRLGKFLRTSSLDELPQLFNVIKGELSLVGPRPVVVEELERYGIYKNKRHIIKPGLTGLWQISGRNDIPYDERIKLDMYYIENWTLRLDISIIIRTMISLIRKNTY